MDTFLKIINTSPKMLYVIINLFIAIPAILLALWRDKTFHLHNPAALPFKWGFFTGFRIIFVTVTLFLISVFNLLPSGANKEDIVWEMSFGMLFFFIPSIFIILRHRWAWIAYTIFSLNPALWIINTIYIRKRWNEFKKIPIIATPQEVCVKTESPYENKDDSKTKADRGSYRKKSKKIWIIVLSLLAIVIIFISTVALLFVRNFAAQAPNMPVYLAFVRGDMEGVQRLINSGENVDAKGLNGWTALIYAARNGNIEAVKMLLKAGANPNIKDNFKWSPLHHAILKNRTHNEIIKILIKYGADVNAVDSHLRTPLHRAAQFGHTEAVSILIENGADQNAKDENGLTPVDRGKGQLHMFRKMYESAADAE